MLGARECAGDAVSSSPKLDLNCEACSMPRLLHVRCDKPNTTKRGVPPMKSADARHGHARNFFKKGSSGRSPQELRSLWPPPATKGSYSCSSFPLLSVDSSVVISLIIGTFPECRVHSLITG